MTLGYVYSPMSGYVTADDRYCDDQSLHIVAQPALGFDKPTDISAPAEGSAVCLYASTCFQSAIIEHSSVCLDPSLIPQTYAVIVRLCLQPYGQQEVGAVLFGHLSSRISPQTITGLLWNITLGYVPPVCSPPCDCYRGYHVHLEARQGVRLVSCGDTAPRGSRAIYEFSF